jgi:hypothetical protein
MNGDDSVIVRLFWRDCRYRHNEWTATRIDAFWVEATLEEAEAAIYPRLTQERVAESKALAERWAEHAKSRSQTSYCFLVARDLSSIDPHAFHYPFHHMWNAYSPFAEMPERKIEQLEELATIVLPSVDGAGG